MDANKGDNQKQDGIVIAILNDETEEWEFTSFETRDEARQAVNEARRQGKAAVFYSGVEGELPPEF